MSSGKIQGRSVETHLVAMKAAGHINNFDYILCNMCKTEYYCLFYIIPLNTKAFLDAYISENQRCILYS